MALFKSTDSTIWTTALSSYSRALDAVAAEKKDPAKLKSLDAWFCNSKLEKDRRALDKASLSRIVEWKLSRGTFRPGLLQKAQSNSEQAVKTAYQSAKALLLAANAAGSSAALEAATEAIRVLDKSLFGVGPATATAVLSRCFPEAVAFMSDEAMLACGLFKKKSELKYDIKTFSRFNELMQTKALSLTSCGKRKWTGNDVAKALWAETVLAPETSPKTSPGPVSKRPAAESNDMLKKRKMSA
eukprot:TRINITY_DN54597_c0_g1_i1.p1 TRINITY_DN54597_c0_g1~~TRINITY_DN54597_c0_g1_i1.p1  ORF type:complete len:254 (+),score=72.87 TRINITY_DN54597_c0_g1_i1:34-762(+)